MCNRLTIKVTKFQQSTANHFLTVAKKTAWGANLPPPYKLGLMTLFQLHKQDHKENNVFHE